MNKKRLFYNLVSGSLGQLLMVAAAILVPRLVMVNISSEANGLLSSVNQMLVYLGLMEAGVGTVTIQALFQPVSEQNRDGICSILAATKKYYLRTGTMYMIGVVLFSVLYPILVDSELPLSTVILVILFSGSSGAVGFFFHSKFVLLLQAEGKNYILTSISTLAQISISIIKVVLLINGFDIVAVQGAYLLMMLAQSAAICIYTRRNYPWLNLSVKPQEQAISQKYSALLHQMCGLIFNNTDSLLLTLTWGLRYVSVYSVFTMVFSQLGNLVTIWTTSYLFVLGQALQQKFEQFQKEYRIFEMLSFLTTFVLGSVSAVMITPFIRLYTDGVTDVDYLNPWYPPLFMVVFLLTNLRAPAQTAITAAGHFKKTTPQAIAEAVINLLVSLILLPKFGIIGVLIGTIVALGYRVNEMFFYSSKNIHKVKLSKTYGRILRNLVLFFLFSLLAKPVSAVCDSIVMFIVCGFVCTVAALILFLGANALVEREMFKEIISPLLKKFCKNQS